MAKCRGSWASERFVSSGAAQLKHFHGQENQVTLEHSTGTRLANSAGPCLALQDQAGPAEPYLIVAGATGRSGFAGIKSLLLCAKPELKSLEKFQTPFPAAKCHPGLLVSHEQRQHRVLRSVPHTKGAKVQHKSPCECREALRLPNTSHGKTKQSQELDQGQCKAAPLPGLAGDVQRTEGVVVLPPKAAPSPPGNSGAAPSAALPFPAAPRAHLQVPCPRRRGVTARFCSWQQPAGAQLLSVFGAHCLRQDFKALISQHFHSTLRNQPGCTS